MPPEFAKSLNVVYFPQLGKVSDFYWQSHCLIFFIGYLICVPMLEEWQNDVGIRGLDGWTFQVSVDFLLLVHSFLI